MSGVYFPEAIDVIADVCRQTAGARMIVIEGAQRHGWGGYTFDPTGQMNHHTGRGGWVPLLNFMHHGSSIAPLCNGATSNPYETDGTVIVAVTACGRANHAGKGIWSPDVPTNAGNRLLWGWEHQHPGDQSPWHPLHREVILRLNVGLNLAFGWDAANVPDHKDYAPGRKVDRAHEDGDVWRDLIRQRMMAGTISGRPKTKERHVTAKRIGGDTRHETAIMLARTRWQDDTGGIAFLVNPAFKDSAAVANVADMGRILTVDKDKLPDETRAELGRVKPDQVIAVGGPNAVSDRVLEQARKAAV